MPAPPILPVTTQRRAELHEALHLRLSTLYRDVAAMAARRPGAKLVESVRIVAEGLLADCAPFTRQRGERLPVAAPDYGGLLVQLGQALAQLDAYEARFAYWDRRRAARVWRIAGHEPLPIMRLKPQISYDGLKTAKGRDMREQLARLIDARNDSIFEQGFAAGRAARVGPPAPSGADPVEPGGTPKTYPRLRGLG